jgi:hypothetical protein
MQWFRKLLGKRAERSAKVSPKTSNGFRPQVESLDDRIVPTVSTAITNIGTFTTAVDINHNLVAVDPTSGNLSQTGITNVRTAQIFRDGTGGLGADIIFQDGSWRHIDSGPLGSFTISADQAKNQLGGLVLDAGTAYDKMGQIRLDILVSADNMVDTNGNTYGDALGSVKEFNQAFGGGLADLGLGSNIQWVSAYNATDGGTGIAFGQVDKNVGTAPFMYNQLTAKKFDFATGVTTLYVGAQFSAGAITEYSQTTSMPSALPALLAPNTPPAVIIDVTFEGQATKYDAMFGAQNDGGYALQFSSGGSATVGGLLGGGAATTGPNVLGIVNPDGNIETGILYPKTQFHP